MNKTPPIEEQIRDTIAKAIGIAHKEQEQVIIDTIKVTVNGKIDAFRKDQSEVNEAQNKSLAEIKESIKGVVEVYNGSSSFFKGAKIAAGWVTAIASAGVALWALIRFVVFNAK